MFFMLEPDDTECFTAVKSLIMLVATYDED